MNTKTLNLSSALMLSAALVLSACSSNDIDEVSADDTSADEVSVDANAKTSDSADAASQLTETDGVIKNSDASAEQVSSPIDTNPALSSDNPSLVNNPTQAGTPEDAVKQALNTLYYGDVKEAANYYKVDIANFEQELAKTQYAFQQTVEGVTITNTTYNADKTRATIEGELMLKGQKQPAPLTYELQKVEGEWKILG